MDLIDIVFVIGCFLFLVSGCIVLLAIAYSLIKE